MRGMTRTGKIILTCAASLAAAALVLCCVHFKKAPEVRQAGEGTAADAPLQALLELSSAAEAAWRDETAERIELSDEGSSSSSQGVLIQGSTVTVTSSGTYSVSGALSEGQLRVDCDGTAVLILDGADIRNSSDAAVYVSDAGHVMIYLPEGSESSLVSGAECEITAAEGNAAVESASGAALYSRDSLSFAGSGRLTVRGYVNNAVATTDSLTVLGGKLELTAVNNGLKGKDSVTVAGGALTVHSGGDGIKSNNADCGVIDVLGGEISIVSLGDGMQAAKELNVEGGVITVTAGDAANSAPAGDAGLSVPPEAPQEPQVFEKPPEGGPGGMRPEGSGRPGDREEAPSPRPGDNPPERPEGTEPGAFHGGGEEQGFPGGFGPGTASASHSKALNSGGSITVSGGEITVTQSYEGLEGHQIYLRGGSVSITASDDGVNANGSAGGGSDMPALVISGGTIRVNAGGDGLDSNGDLIIDGGYIIVDGPSDGGNGALDSGFENGGSIVCNGGTVLAIGDSRMAESFEDDSKQCSFILNFSGTLPAGTRISISDEGGGTLFEHSSAKSFNSVVFSCPELQQGRAYTVTAGTETRTLTLDGITSGDTVSAMPAPPDKRG